MLCSSKRCDFNGNVNHAERGGCMIGFGVSANPKFPGRNYGLYRESISKTWDGQARHYRWIRMGSKCREKSQRGAREVFRSRKKEGT